MTRLSWDTVGERFYETGVDRGVLYIDSEAGVPWNGIVSIDESPSGGDAKPYYQDGIKYANRAAPEEYEATLTAFSSPIEFDSVDGSLHLASGLTATQQRRKLFGLSYRTKIGNDVDGVDYGYKIHLLYNVLAAPSNEQHETINENVNPITFSWALTATPISGTGFKPTAHFIIDSLTTDSTALATLEDILYGSDSSAARLPTFEEIAAIYAGGDGGDGGGIDPPVIYDAMLYVGRQSIETVIKGLSAARAARQSIETIIKGISKSRVSRQSIETIIKGDSKAKVSRQSIEVVITN